MVKQARTCPGVDIKSDHVPVVSIINRQLKNVEKYKQHRILDCTALMAKYKQHRILDCTALMANKKMKSNNAIGVSNRLANLEEQNKKPCWEIFKGVIAETSKELIPPCKLMKLQN